MRETPPGETDKGSVVEIVWRGTPGGAELEVGGSFFSAMEEASSLTMAAVGDDDAGDGTGRSSVLHGMLAAVAACQCYRSACSIIFEYLLHMFYAYYLGIYTYWRKQVQTARANVTAARLVKLFRFSTYKRPNYS